MGDNFYEILQVPTDADEREIKNAYHRLARELHPDKAVTTDEVKTFEAQFARVSAAYNILKDAAKRSEYDALQGTGSGLAQPQRPTATASVLTAGRGVPKPNLLMAPSTGSSATTRPPLGLTPEKASIAQKAFARGMQFFKDGNFVKAIEFFEAAIQNNDGEGIYHARLALSLIQARKSATRAIDAAQRAIDLEPYNLEYKFNMAQIFEAIGSKTNAKKIYEEILRWDTGSVRATAALEGLKKKRGPFGLGGGGEDNGKPGFLQQLLGKFKK